MLEIVRVEHGVSFTCACHSIDEKGGIVSFKNIIDRLSHTFFKNLHIFGFGFENFLIVENGILLSGEDRRDYLDLLRINDFDGWWLIITLRFDSEIYFDILVRFVALLICFRCIFRFGFIDSGLNVLIFEHNFKFYTVIKLIKNYHSGTN